MSGAGSWIYNKYVHESILSSYLLFFLKYTTKKEEILLLFAKIKLTNRRSRDKIFITEILV